MYVHEGKLRWDSRLEEIFPELINDDAGRGLDDRRAAPVAFERDARR